MKATTQALFDAAFTPGRTPRSPAYCEGVRAKLRLHIQKVAMACPYAEGTAEFDAFQAGIYEGRHILKAQS